MWDHKLRSLFGLDEKASKIFYGCVFMVFVCFEDEILNFHENTKQRNRW